jgi:hypothetical protein
MYIVGRFFVHSQHFKMPPVWASPGRHRRRGGDEEHALQGTGNGERYGSGI